MLSLNLSSGPGDDGYLPVVGREQEGLPTNTEERRRKEMIAVNPSSGPREEDNQTRLSIAAVPESVPDQYPVSLGGCQGLYDLWVKFNISASATTQTTCDPVNQDYGLQTKTVLQSICARQASLKCLILDHHVSI